MITWAKRVAIALAAFLLLVAVVLSGLWRQRTDLGALELPQQEPVSTVAYDGVTVTWLGVSTLLFDDGDTQILIDGFFSRPSLLETLLRRPIDNDAATINFAMNEYRMRRLAAIIPVHSHFDHAMDVGAVANRSSASVLGSASTAAIARGAGVPEDQIIVVDEGQQYSFGEFRVAMLQTPHAPVGWRGSVPLDGSIDRPLTMPQPISAFRMGGAWSIVIEHPKGTSLVVGSAGFKKYALRGTQVDTVFLGVGLLDTLGREYAELYWQHTVTATGASTVYPIHFDDYTQPFGTILTMPNFLSNFATIAKLLTGYRDRWDNQTAIYVPPFGEPIAIYETAGS